MSNFNEAVQKVLRAEGGYVNHPADRGGPTNHGITQKVYNEWMAKKTGKNPYISTIDEIKNMPVGNAIQIYKENYWDAIQGDKIKKFSIAAMIFDQAVNAGVPAAVRRAQRVVQLPETGKMDDQTLRVLNSTSEKTFIENYYNATVAFYNAIVEKNPSQEVFIKGWLKRARELRDYGLSWFGIPNSTAVGIGIGALVIFGIGGFFLYKYMKAKKGLSAMPSKVSNLVPEAA
jgi:lysozyme family protein